MIFKPLTVFVLFIITLTSADASRIKDELHRLTSQNHRSYSYSEARKILLNKIHLGQDSKGYLSKSFTVRKSTIPSADQLQAIFSRLPIFSTPSTHGPRVSSVGIFLRASRKQISITSTLPSQR